MITLTLTNEAAGKIRPVHGVNLAAPIVNAKTCRIVSEDLRKLGIPLTRMHDAVLDNPGMRLVDISCVFPNYHADHTKPENYYFDQTDDYFANAWDYGTEIMYRLGVSIEHSANHYWTKPPADYRKWAEICMNIIRHYPRIEYWEIWNEADTELPLLWDGTWTEFIRFYIETASLLKAEFPHLKIGGPSMSRLTTNDGTYVREFLAACRENHAPLDFFTYHQYSDKPEKIIATPQIARDLLDEYGYPETEIHLAEWHYHPGWGSGCTLEREGAVFEMMLGTDAATYLGSVLTGWQNTPLTMGQYYTGSIGRGYALFTPGGLRTPGFYVMEFFNRLTKMPQGVKADSSDADTWLLSAESDTELLAMACSFKTAQNDVKIDLGTRRVNPDNCKLYVLDYCGVPRLVDSDIIWMEHTLTFEKVSGSAVVMLEYTK